MAKDHLFKELGPWAESIKGMIPEDLFPHLFLIHNLFHEKNKLCQTLIFQKW